MSEYFFEIVIYGIDHAIGGINSYCVVRISNERLVIITLLFFTVKLLNEPV
jgi:hypothetical protein